MFEAKSKDIDGIHFQVMPFPAIEALRLKAYLLRVFGPALGQAIGAFTSGKKPDAGASALDRTIDGAGLSLAIQSLFEQLGEDEFISLLRRMFAATSATLKLGNTQTQVNMGEEFDKKMDMVFQGKLFTIYPVLLFILEVNFPDFFAKAGAIGTRLSTLMSKQASGSGLPLQSESGKLES